MSREPDERSRSRRTPLGGRVARGASLAKLSASTSSSFAASQVRRLRDGDAAELAFHADTAQRIVELLGSMKGAAMKVGQIISFVDLDLPPEVQATYHEALAQLRSAAPPIDPVAIADVVTEEFGAPPEEVFRTWDRTPIASASIGQVHRATLPDGTEVVAKVQYPGVAEAVRSDLANAEAFAPLSKVISPNLKLRPLLDEVRERLDDELDYQREADYQAAFADRYDGHPFIRIPRIHPEWCRPRVLCSEYVDGRDFDAFVASADESERRRAGEIIYRFTFGSIHRFRLFNADPHPGNYLFDDEGRVTFLDFGSVKAFGSAARDLMADQIRAVMADDVDAFVTTLAAAGFRPPGDPERRRKLMDWFRAFNEPIVEDRETTYTPEFARAVIRSTTDPRDGYIDLLRRLNLPPDYLTLNRIQWGVNSILGRLGARANWHRITMELLGDAPPTTDLGRAEADFMAASPHRR